MSAARKKAAMKERMARLERENEEMKARLSMIEIQEASSEPLRDLPQLHSSEFKLTFASGVNELRSEIVNVKGVEFCLKVERIHRKDGRSGSEGFHVTVCMKNVSGSDEVLVQTCVTVLDVDHYRSHSFNNNLCEYFMLYKRNREEFGMRRKHSTSDYNTATTVQYRLTVGVQPISASTSEDDRTVAVIVQDKEFRVNASYLAQWSEYFRAYFNADMKEKREGRYPIKDSNISAEDFEELLMVILPSDRPISSHNYKMLLRLASRFEMPQLTLRIERFLLDFERNGLTRAAVFRVAMDKYDLKLVQASLLDRWKDASVLREELLNTVEYGKLNPTTKILINQRFAQASITKKGEEEYGCESEDDNGNILVGGLVFDVSDDDDDDLYLNGS